MVMISKENLKAVIFDLDGVVLDSMDGHSASWAMAFAEFGLGLEREFFMLNEGALDSEMLAENLRAKGHEITPGLFNKVYQRQRDIYRIKFKSSVTVYPGISAIIEYLKTVSSSIALATSSNQGVLSDWLWGWLNKYFDVIITGDQVSRTKPDPEPYLKAMENLEVENKNAVAVENAPAGITSAKRAGLNCIALTTTLPENMLSGADMVMKDHQPLLGYLTWMFG